eukprot:359015-Chlamydomonas_euryale.AAC.3
MDRHHTWPVLHTQRRPHQCSHTIAAGPHQPHHCGRPNHSPRKATCPMSTHANARLPNGTPRSASLSPSIHTHATPVKFPHTQAFSTPVHTHGSPTPTGNTDRPIVTDACWARVSSAASDLSASCAETQHTNRKRDEAVGEKGAAAAGCSQRRGVLRTNTPRPATPNPHPNTLLTRVWEGPAPTCLTGCRQLQLAACKLYADNAAMQ